MHVRNTECSDIYTRSLRMRRDTRKKDFVGPYDMSVFGMPNEVVVVVSMLKTYFFASVSVVDHEFVILLSFFTYC